MTAANSPSSIIFDIDGTLCPLKKPEQEYADLPVDQQMVDQLRAYHEQGFRIVLYTARNMRTHQGSLGRINKHTAPVLIEWLARHDIPYDEIYFGKPWPGPDGFYVDDRTVRPDEFKRMSQQEIAELTASSAVTADET